MESNDSLEVVDACTLITLRDGTKYIGIVNQALLDTDRHQTESLLQPHQCRAHNTAVDKCPTRYHRPDGSPGGQCIQTPDHTLDLHFDGWKCFLSISMPTEDDFNRYPRVELTAPTPYEPQRRLYSRCMHKVEDVTDEEWRARLGYPTLEVAKKTVDSTTQLVKTLEAETREYMRDHRVQRVYSLRPKRINDTLYSDTFFSSIPSIRGYRMFQMFAFKECKVDIIKLMRRESQAPEMYRDIIRKVGAPNMTITDNARVMTGNEWTKINRLFCIDDGRTVPHHQNQNTAERRGGAFKLSLLKLFHNTPWAPLSYWCYAADFLNLIRPFLTQKSLNWRPGQEVLRGETQDISIFRFPWFSPIWYYDPAVSFPDGKMLPGFFLGVAPSVGDGFSYIILPVEKYENIPTHRNPTTLVRSVVRKRDITQPPTAAPTCQETLDGFKFFNADGEELAGEDDLYVAPSEEDAMDIADGAAAPLEVQDEDMPMADAPAHDPPVLNGLIEMATVPLEPIPEEPEEHPIILSPSPNADALASPITADGTPHDSGSSDAHVPMVSQTQSEDPHDEDAFSDSEDQDDAEPRSHLVQDVNNFFNRDEGDDTDDLHAILGWRVVDGILELEVEYSSGSTESGTPSLLSVMRTPTQSQSGSLQPIILNGRHHRWARSFLRSLKRTMRRMHRVNFFDNRSASFSSEEPKAEDESYSPSVSCRRAQAAAASTGNTQKKRKPKCKKSNKQMGNFKYGLEVPANFKQAVRIDEAAGNRKWQEAVIKEMSALIHLKCFDFKTPKFKPPSNYQLAPLKLIYDIKSDLCYKARLVCQGFKVDPHGLSTRATVVKGASVCLLDLIAAHTGLRVLTGDIGNAFVQANTKEKVYCVCGPEFGDRRGCIAIITKALYGLTTSAERYRALFADFLRSLGFTPTRYDRDVWMRMRESNDGYDYICTHVDDFRIVARDPEYWMQRVEQAFLVKESGPPDYYLGNDYKYHKGAGQNIWTYGCATYVKEAIRHVESEFGVLRKNKSALPTRDTHPETDTSPLLGEKDHRRYQMLLGMMQWMNTIGRLDLCHACALLNRFGSCPREKHLDLALHVFGYLKQFPDRRIAIDPRPLVYERGTPIFREYAPDFLQDYPDAKEDIDPNLPQAFGSPLQTTILVDADHAHDLKTRRSITGLILFVGSTPIKWISKRQGTHRLQYVCLRVLGPALSRRGGPRCSLYAQMPWHTGPLRR